MACTLDFRRLDEGLGGPKNKRKRSEPDPVRVSRHTKTPELRNKEKEMKRAFRERVNELKEEIRSNKAERRKKREEREKKKKENVLKSGTKLQKITNPKTLKKIAKSKERKLLKVVPDDVVNGGSKKGMKTKK
ncbi:protein PXR1 [Asparagus officinalis]|uniref:protein PXR1 n=1 Tax=Asparagus officinalis TaxID=4686 RepID=UPI00098E6F6C|nr:protein PXR1 [Asparagus officinalis]